MRYRHPVSGRAGTGGALLCVLGALACTDSTGPQTFAPIDPQVELVATARVEGGGIHVLGFPGLPATDLDDRPEVLDLTPDFTIVRGPDWSPDGRLLAFQGTMGSQTGVFVLDGTGVPARIPLDSLDGLPRWSPDGTRIALSVPWGVLWVVSIASPERFLITPPELRCDDPPSWAPDGRRLAAACRRQNDGASVLVAAEADGSGLETLATAPEGEYLVDASWSPTGDAIAVVRQTASGGSVLELYGSDGSLRTQTTLTTAATAGFPGPPSWSPDGSRIAVRLSAPDAAILGICDVATARLDLRRGPTALPRTWPPPDRPAWSPDGRAIAFLVARFDPAPVPDPPAVTGYAGSHVYAFSPSQGLQLVTPVLVEPLDGGYRVAWRPTPRRVVPFR
jgi:Tol biopolymer transport system component